MKTLSFATREGFDIGRATLDGDTLTCDPMAEGIMKAMRWRVGDVRAFAYFAAGWSNGYAHSNLITEPDDDDKRGAPDATGKRA